MGSNRSIATQDMHFPTQRDLLSGPQSDSAGIEGYLQFALRSVHEQPDDVNTVFFSRANVDYLQARIVRDVRKLTGFTIGRQSDEALVQIMIGVYAMDGSSVLARDRVTRLNNLVMRTCVRQCVEGASGYSGYVRDASKNLTPLPMPENPSIRGTDSLPPWL